MSDITYRTIQTGLENNPVNESIMSSVLSQMSDGYWEECSQMQGYWKCADVCRRDSGIVIDVWPISWYMDTYSKSISNRFYGMNDGQILLFFARKIRFLARQNLKDDYEEAIRDKMISFKGALIPTAEIEKFNKERDAYNEYIIAHPFQSRGVFNEYNLAPCIYLSAYDSSFPDSRVPVTVADCVRVYNVLVKKAAELGEKPAEIVLDNAAGA